MAATNDSFTMECMACQELFSASLDGEIGIDQLTVVSRHLERCGACRSFADQAQRLHRRLRVSSAPGVPDLTDRVVHRIAPDAPPDRRLRMLRGVLLLVAATQLGLAVPTLFLGSEDGLPMHLTHHMGALQLALAVGFASVAIRPRIALAGFLPLATALVLTGSVLAVVDIIRGETTVMHETAHIAALIGLVAAWMIESSFRPLHPLRSARHSHRGLEAAT